LPGRQVSFAVAGSPSALAGDARVVEARWSQPHGTEKAASKDSLLRPSRVTLEDGRTVVAWIQPNVDWGNRALVQTFEADGTAASAPIAISPEGMEVVGALETSVRGDTVEVTFAACDGHHLQKMAVSFPKP